MNHKLNQCLGWVQGSSLDLLSAIYKTYFAQPLCLRNKFCGVYFGMHDIILFLKLTSYFEWFTKSAESTLARSRSGFESRGDNSLAFDASR